MIVLNFNLSTQSLYTNKKRKSNNFTSKCLIDHYQSQLLHKNDSASQQVRIHLVILERPKEAIEFRQERRRIYHEIISVALAHFRIQDDKKEERIVKL